MIAQAIFFCVYFVVYLLSPATAHRVVGYFEEEAVVSYTNYLAEIDSGKQPNVPAPRIAIDYWRLGEDARLRDVVLAVRADEAGHRDRNHELANALIDGNEDSLALGRPMAEPTSLHAVAKASSGDTETAGRQAA
jgi:ubiquinol oxidase